MSLDNIKVGDEVVERRCCSVHAILTVSRLSKSRIFTIGRYNTERSWHRKNGREFGSGGGWSRPTISLEVGEKLQGIKDSVEKARLAEVFRSKNWDFFTLDTLRKVSEALKDDANVKKKEAAAHE